MKQVSTKVDERARKIESLILQRLSEKTQTAIALELDVSESTISRFKNNDLNDVSKIISALGLKVVDETDRVVKEETLMSYKRMAFEYLAMDLNVDVN